jgi:DNA-binding CsgD family transcriptional regulator
MSALDSLTPREHEVLRLLRTGLTDGEIAAQLGISTSTARHHVARIIGKLGVRNRYEAAFWPERPPWWVGAPAIAPFAWLWRKTGAALPVKASTLAAAVSGGGLVAVLAAAGLTAFLVANAGTPGDGIDHARAADDVLGDTPAVLSDSAAIGNDDAALDADERASAAAQPVDTPVPPLSSGAPSDGGTPAPPQATPPPETWRCPNADGCPNTMAADCDAALDGIQLSCQYGVGATFAIQVHVGGPPEGGYSAFQAKLRWTDGAVDYLPAVDLEDEALWPQCTIPARYHYAFLEPSVLFGCAPFPPLPQASTALGPVLQFAFGCAAHGQSSLELVPKEGDMQHGTHFIDSSGSEADPTLLSAQVTCGPCPDGGCPPPPPPVTPPPTPTKVPTSSVTPQPTVTPCPPHTCEEVLFEEISVDSISTSDWVDCLWQAAVYPEPRLFVGPMFFLVVRDASDWNDAWKLAVERDRRWPSSCYGDIGPPPELPVDLSTEMMVLLIQNHSEGGYALEVDRVSAGLERWVVEARDVDSCLGIDTCARTAAVEYHVRILKLPRTDLPVRLSLAISGP